MEVNGRYLIAVDEASQVGQARRAAARLASSAGFGDEDAGRVGIAVTEAATNLVKHGGGGELLLHEIREKDERGIEFVALDRGRGLANQSEALRDGFSTSGTPGSGLGAIARQASVFDLYSANGIGTAMFVRMWASRREDRANGMPLVGGISVPIPGEEVCGDDWAVFHNGARTTALIVDGLGHGPGAAEAAGQARRVFHDNAERSPDEIVELMHAALRPTRGAAAAIAQIDRGSGVVRFAGVGNICGTILEDGSTRSMVSHHGTLGHDVRKIQQFEYRWPKQGLLVLHSDGLLSQWTLARYPGLARRHPMLVAAVLYRDVRRARDDTTVVAIREPS